jgi:hypothetical protein
MSFRPKKVEAPYRVRVTGGAYEGATGTVVDVYSDGVLGIDTDDGERAFASEEQVMTLREAVEVLLGGE